MSHSTAAEPRGALRGRVCFARRSRTRRLVAAAWAAASVLWLTTLASVAAGATVHVTAAGRGARDGTSLANAYDLAQANQALGPGDTALLYDDDGPFTTAFIEPAADGTAPDQLVRYEAAPGEQPRIAGQLYGARIVGVEGQRRQYIRIQGITFGQIAGYGRWFSLEYADHVWFEDCVFVEGDHHYRYGMSRAENASFNVWYHCEWDISGYDIDSDTQSDTFQIAGDSQHNLVKGCTFRHGVHDTIRVSPTSDLDGFNVLQGNTFYNQWRHGISFLFRFNLVEGNTVIDNGIACNSCPWQADRCGAPVGRCPAVIYPNSTYASVIRYNTTRNSGTTGVAISEAVGDFELTWIYHNTIYGVRQHECENTNFRGKFFYGEGGDPTQLKSFYIFNNIFTQVDGDNGSRDVLFALFDYAYPDVDCLLNGEADEAAITHNIFHDDSATEVRLCRTWNTLAQWQQDLAGQPGSFVLADNLSDDPRLIDPEAGDLQLQPGSAAEDGARPIAYASGAGQSSTILTVPDHHETAFFSVEAWGQSWHGLLESDTIRIGGAQPTAIVDIDYQSHQLHLADPRTWADGDPITLCPAGQCFAGAAPDLGAFERGLPAAGGGGAHTGGAGGGVGGHGGVGGAAGGRAPTSDDDSTSGCGCMITKASTPHALGWSLALLFAARRRRRRQ